MTAISTPAFNTFPITPGAPVVPAPPHTPATPTFESIFDFPTLAAGDTFRIAPGSTANGIGVGGEARLDELTPTSAQVWIKAGRFGFNREATLAVEQLSPTTVGITATEPRKAPVTGTGEIVDVRRNYSEFSSASQAVNGTAILQLDPAGRLVVDVAGGGTAQAAAGVALHLILEKV